jgi:hypothetical protein
MKTDRFLTVIVIGIGVLVVIALALFFTRRSAIEYLTEDRPENIVHNYMLALHKQDYQKAYDYLADLKYKPGFGEFRQYLLGQQIELNRYSLQVGSAAINTDRAVVYCTMVYSNGGPFGTINREPATANLAQTDGKWKISEMPPAYWNYSWFNQNSIPPEIFQPVNPGD